MSLLSLLWLISLPTSCLKTEVLNEIPAEDEAVVEKKRKPLPEHQQPDTTQTDTTRVPIGWNPSVEDWNETNVEL